MGDASNGTMLKGKRAKNPALEHSCDYVSVNVVSKKTCSHINSMTDSKGRFFRNTELFTVSFMLVCISNWYKGTLALSSFQSRTQSEINATKKQAIT